MSTLDIQKKCAQIVLNLAQFFSILGQNTAQMP